MNDAFDAQDTATSLLDTRTGLTLLRSSHSQVDWHALQENTRLPCHCHCRLTGACHVGNCSVTNKPVPIGNQQPAQSLPHFGRQQCTRHHGCNHTLHQGLMYPMVCSASARECSAPGNIVGRLVATQLQKQDAQHGSKRANCNSMTEKQANTTWINLLGCRLGEGPCCPRLCTCLPEEKKPSCSWLDQPMMYKRQPPWSYAAQSDNVAVA